MDGLDNRGEIIVIGATNRSDAIDPALRRPGRVDRELYFPLPAKKVSRQLPVIHFQKAGVIAMTIQCHVLVCCD
jgi:ATP-dependent 26S proteasome regulatory subunit